MVRFTDQSREFWLEQSLNQGEMPKRLHHDNCRCVWSEYGRPVVSLPRTGGLMISAKRGEHAKLSVKRGDEWVEIGNVTDFEIKL